jgi:hypothetical protein
MRGINMEKFFIPKGPVVPYTFMNEATGEDLLGEKTLKSYGDSYLYSKYPMYNKQLLDAIMQDPMIDKKTDMFVSFGARFRYKNSFFKKDLFSNPVYLQFNNIKLPVPVKYDELLSQLYGDYMTPPPKEQQIGSHLIKVDFGIY